MKKLFTLALIGVFSTILTSCSNTGTADLYPEGVNQTHQSEMKASARTSNSASLEDAILATLKDENLVAINNQTLRVVYQGKLLEETEFENNPITNPLDRRRVKTVCKTKLSDGYTISIVHVYDDHYSGYQFVSTSPRGFSVSSEMGPFAIFSCPSLWSMGWD